MEERDRRDVVRGSPGCLTPPIVKTPPLVSTFMNTEGENLLASDSEISGIEEALLEIPNSLNKPAPETKVGILPPCNPQRFFLN